MVNLYVSSRRIPCVWHFWSFSKKLTSRRLGGKKGFAFKVIFCQKHPVNLSRIEASVQRSNNSPMKTWTQHHTPGVERPSPACGPLSHKPHPKPLTQKRILNPWLKSPQEHPPPWQEDAAIFYSNVHWWMRTRELNTASVWFPLQPSVCLGILETTKILSPIIVWSVDQSYGSQLEPLIIKETW